LPAGGSLHLTVAGACADPDLRRRLERRAMSLGPAVTLRLEHLSEAAVDELLADIDALVLPFRQVTTTSTAGQAQAHGVPLVLPDLPALRELREGVLRYDGSVRDLTSTLRAITRLDPHELDALGAAAYDAAHGRTWSDVAAETLDAYRAVTGGRA
jgi:glycosyltransferase involved in cell wall biosynthesis